MQTDLASHLTILPTANFAAKVAELVAEEIRAAILARGQCRLALAGGETPRAIHEALAAQARDLRWEKVWITFGDERAVPPEDPASNYRMAQESLLSRVSIPPTQVLRLQGELPQEQAAALYEGELARVALGEDRYIHDLIMLGMGEDGHTASLFPGSPALEETERNVIATHGPKPPPQRLTMTFPLLNAARKVFLTVGGAGKAPVLKRILAGDRSFPSARIKPVNGEVRWLVTEELAQLARA